MNTIKYRIFDSAINDYIDPEGFVIDGKGNKAYFGLDKVKVNDN